MEQDNGEFAPVFWGGLEMKIRDQRHIHSRLPIPNQKSKIGNRKSRGGFILVLVIVAIIIIGVEMFVLAGMANTMQYQSHRAYLKASERNLLASGLAWARQNAQKSSGESPAQMIELDVSEMDILGSALAVTINAAGDGPEVRIHTSCSRGRQTLKGGGTYKIGRYDQRRGRQNHPG
jgi:hypothetical protein